MAQYVIYSTKSKARFRRWQLTDDARQANFLNPDEEYRQLFNHPIEDKAAIEVVIEEPVYINGLPTRKYDFSIFFTAQENARAIDELSADWFPESEVV
jgi:hypothetical protein